MDKGFLGETEEHRDTRTLEIRMTSLKLLWHVNPQQKLHLGAVSMKQWRALDNIQAEKLAWNSGGQRNNIHAEKAGLAWNSGG